MHIPRNATATQSQTQRSAKPNQGAAEAAAVGRSRSEVWAVGTLAYDLMPSTPNPFAFLADDWTDAQVPPLPRDHASFALRRLVRLLVARDPADRPSPAEAVILARLLLAGVDGLYA